MNKKGLVFFKDSEAVDEVAEAILKAVMKAGMLPPWSNQRDLGCECGCKGYCPNGNHWDYENTPEGALQTPKAMVRR